MSSTDPVIEIAGIWLPNKGAELMAVTAVTEVSARLPQARFCSRAQGPDAARAALGIPAMPEADRTIWHSLRKPLPFLAEARALRADRPGVTHVIDASGFAYGDDWGANKARKRAGAFLRAGYPVYMLPQAYGPFEDPKLRREMAYIVSHVRRIAARDPQSLGYLQSLDTGRDIAVVPDVTLGLKPDLARVPAPAADFVAVVTNAKLTGSGAFDEATVRNLYTQVIKRVQDAGLTPVLVLHEPVADRALSEALAQETGAAMVAHDDPRDLKSCLAQAQIVVTARFHGLANGLSSGVPSMAIGWSHKYQELLRDFDCPDMAFNGDAPDFLRRLSELLASPEARMELRQRLERRKTDMAARMSAYWDDLAEDIAAR